MDKLIFTAPGFWYFFLVALILLSLTKNKVALRNAFLFIASIFFYSQTSGWFILILLFSTLADYVIGWIMYNEEGISRKLLLILSILINLGLLGFFKYADFSATGSKYLFLRKPSKEVIN